MPVRHLFVCREYPPAAHPAGGIGTYVHHIARLLAAAGDTVHVIAQRWPGAPARRDERMNGRLIVHRVALDEPSGDPATAAALLGSPAPAQAFAWQAALAAESLIAHHGIDVIEGQEWEAPLYHLQLRRAQNLAPARRPPCVVHVHSPTERIYAANGWDTSVADYAPTAAMEEYSILAADAILCASVFIAGEVVARYGIDRSRLTVVPYPAGDAPTVVRRQDVWSTGTVCHVGRLEPRKGVLEWMDAIAAVAGEYPHARFELVGSDTPLQVTGGGSTAAAAWRRLPPSLRARVTHLGARDRDGVIAALARARLAVVPSRWDNFPYAAIEAMATGLPVLASPCGGMRELVEDGVSGWIAAAATPAAMAASLRQAFGMPAERLAGMGLAAAARVRAVCDDEHVRARHVVFKSTLAERAPQLRQPAAVPLAVAPAKGVRYSAMAQAIRRDHQPLLRWFLTLAPADRRALLRRAAVQPWPGIRWLLQRLQREAADG